MKKNLLFILVVVISILPCYNLLGQQYGKIRGFVTDSTTGEVLAFGNAYVEELKVGSYTDANGAFLINKIPAGRSYKVIISYVGYNSKTLDVFVAPNKITEIYVELNPSGVALQEVQKIGEKVIDKNATDIGLERIDVRRLEILPKGVETDVFRSLQFLPGVQSTGDVSARYYVRGGASNQNLVMLNGITVYNPFHALGIFSVFDPDMINSLEFYKGGFTAEYGSRLSSVMSIVSKDGNKNNFGMKASSSFLTGKVLLEGPIPNGSFMLTGRKNYSNEILKQFLNDKEAPIDFYDVSFKANYSNPDLIKNGKFVAFGFLSSDELDENDPQSERFNWKNNIFGFQWIQFYDSPLFTNLNISFSEFTGEVDPRESPALKRSNSVNDMTIGLDATYIFDSEDEIGVGVNFKLLDTKLYLENNTGAVTELNTSSANFSLYGKYKLLRYENFGIDIGTRINMTGLAEKSEAFFPEPRVSVTYRIIPEVALKAAWGIYQQEMATISDENEIISLFEPWVITPGYLNPSRAIHYTGGIDFDFLSNLTLSLEGYFKTIKDLPIINDQKVYSSDPDLVSGKGEAYGWEALFNFSPHPFNIIASYSLSWAYNEVDDWVYRPKYDTRHSVNLSLEYDFGYGWTASAVWIYSSGLPFTQLAGFYDKTYFTNFFTEWYLNTDERPFSILSDKNLGVLPDYHRLDLSVGYKFPFFFTNMTIDVSVINVYDRKNIFYFERDTGERVNMLPLLPTATVKIEI